MCCSWNTANRYALPPELRSAVAHNLRSFERRESEHLQTPAAVAIVLLSHAGAACVPIFQRTLTMSRHAGQMALPGGKVHEGETVEECAIRELQEELGLAVDASDILGKLDDFDTRSGFTITPVMIWSGAEAVTLQPEAAEVGRLFLVSTPELREAVALAKPGEAFSLVFPAVEVFAPTAAILCQFSEVALDGRQTRVADFHQPPWTHR
ncbi:MAG TPA: CoA pyrophosphatase [Candidatus Dormibacteraeota bacterium]